MHSFIFEKFVEYAHLKLEPLEFTLTLSTPTNKLLLATHRINVGSLTASGRVLDAMLIILCLHDFDLILGMD